MTLWLVGETKEDRETPRWEFVGIYSDRGVALGACTGALHFLVPVTLNETAPAESTEFENCVYPLAVA